jgi:hypothetical protein
MKSWFNKTVTQVEIDFQAMMIWFIAAILILVRKEGKKLIMVSPPTNDDPADYLCISTGSESTFKHANMRFDPSNGKIIKNCVDV